MLDGWMRLAKKNQVLIVTPFTLAGHGLLIYGWGGCAIHSRSSLRGCFGSIYSTCAACVIGTFTSNVDMKPAPAFGTPEYMRATK